MFGLDAGFLIFEYIRQIIKKVPFYECQVTDLEMLPFFLFLFVFPIPLYKINKV